MIILGPKRDKELGITPEAMNKRAEKLSKPLDGPMSDIGMFVAEGQGMVGGTTFETGSDLAYFLSEYLKFGIACLMEQGYLSKTLPKQSKKKEEAHVGQYL